MTQVFFDRAVLRYPKIVCICVLIVAGLLAFQARYFRLDASAETLVLEDDKDLQYRRLIAARYGQHDFLVLAYTPKADMFSQDTLAALSRLHEELESLKRVTCVQSILNVPLLQSPPVSLKEITDDIRTLRSPKTDKDLARVELSQSPLYRNLLLSPDLRTTALIINFSDDDVYLHLRHRRSALRQKEKSGLLTTAERAELKHVLEQFHIHHDRRRNQRHEDIAAIRSIMDKFHNDAEMFLGGVEMIADDMITFIKNDLRIFGIGVLIFLILMLAVIFGKLRWVCLPILCCAVSVVCMVGLLGWFGWEVTVISANFISLQLIMTLAIAIHLIVRYRELLARNRQTDNHRLILDTVMLKIKPCVYAVLTTIAGFGSLVLCDILPVVTFGWMMIAGLIISLVVTFLLFPSVLILMPKPALSKKRRWHFPITTILAGFTQNYGSLIIGISGIILILSLIGISRLRVENSFIDYFKETSEIYRGMKIVDQRLGGTTPLDVIVDFKSDNAVTGDPAAESDEVFDEFDEFDKSEAEEKYWFTAEKTNRIKQIHRYLSNLPEIGKVVSLANMLDIAEKLNDGKPLDSFELALLYSETPEKFKNLLIKPYVSVENNQVRFWARVKDSQETLRRNELLKKIEQDLTTSLKFNGENIHLTGMLVLYNNMLQSLFGSQIITLSITIIILSAMFFVLFRSLKITFIAMFTNILPIAAVLGLMGWMDIPLDMMTITIAAIGVGIAVDDTIHYIHRFKAEFSKDRNYLNTMHRCHESIGHAMYYTSVTIIIGFSILALSNFIPTVYFGLLTGLAMLVALIAALTLLPRLMILTKPFGKETLE